MRQLFATLDADMNPVEIEQGRSFQTFWQLDDEAPDTFIAAERSHSPAALELYGFVDLARYRISTVALPDAEAGWRLVGYALAVDGDVISVDATFEEMPAVPAPRRLIAKDLVMSRLDAEGLVEAAQGALLRRPVLFGRWFSKEWPEVYADDPDMLAVLAAIGADVETITAA